MQYKKYDNYTDWIKFINKAQEELLGIAKYQMDLAPHDGIFILNRPATIDKSKHKWDDNKKQWSIGTPDYSSREYYNRLKNLILNDEYKIEYELVPMGDSFDTLKDIQMLDNMNKLKDHCLNWKQEVSRVMGIDSKWLQDESRTATDIVMEERVVSDFWRDCYFYAGDVKVENIQIRYSGNSINTITNDITPFMTVEIENKFYGYDLLNDKTLTIEEKSQEIKNIIQVYNYLSAVQGLDKKTANKWSGKGVTELDCSTLEEAFNKIANARSMYIGTQLLDSNNINSSFFNIYGGSELDCLCKSEYAIIYILRILKEIEEYEIKQYLKHVCVASKEPSEDWLLSYYYKSYRLNRLDRSSKSFGVLNKPYPTAIKLSNSSLKFLTEIINKIGDVIINEGSPAYWDTVDVKCKYSPEVDALTGGKQKYVITLY